MLFQLAEGALAIEEIPDKEQSQRAETKIGHAQRPLIAFGVHKHQGVHEHSQAAGKNQYEDSGENRKLQAPPLKTIKFLTINCRHIHTYVRQLPPRAFWSCQDTNRFHFGKADGNRRGVLLWRKRKQGTVTKWIRATTPFPAGW